MPALQTEVKWENLDETVGCPRAREYPTLLCAYCTGASSMRRFCPRPSAVSLANARSSKPKRERTAASRGRGPRENQPLGAGG